MVKSNSSIAVLIVLAIAWFLQPLQAQCAAAEPERISVDQVKGLLDNQADMIIVDTRGERSYAAGHIPGAISMPFPDGIRSRNQELPRDRTIILYCS